MPSINSVRLKQLFLRPMRVAPVRNFLWLPYSAMMGGFIPFLPLLKGNVRIAMQAVLLGVGFTALLFIYVQAGDGHWLH